MALDTALAWPFSSSGNVQFVGRAFGSTASDLNVDFRSQTRPSIVTELVTLCVTYPDGGEISSDKAWHWTTTRRTQALLTIAVRTAGPRLELGVTCPNRDCGELLELPLRLTDFEQDEKPSRIACEINDGPTLDLRLPTGADQRRWWQQGLLDEADKAAMAKGLVTMFDGEPPRADWQVDPEWLDEVEQSLQGKDPLTDLSIETGCPHCEARFSVDVDLEKELLSLLERRQPRLLDEIHCIATAYHWTEDQIMNLSPTRRNQYLARIDGDEI